MKNTNKFLLVLVVISLISSGYLFAEVKNLKKGSSEITPVKTDTVAGSTDNTVNNVVKKTDKPSVELFVMSQCPYGTQIEKGIISVVEKLGKKIDFEVKFVDYAMHGEVELKEQLNQYCIQKDQNAKYLSYLKCFLKAGDSESCIKQSGVNQSDLTSCVAKTDSKYKIMSNFKNKVGYKGNFAGFDIYKSENEKYGVAGSPTLVINGAQAETGRDSNSLLKTICSAFNNAPEECNSNLSSDTPAPGFGEGTQTGGGANGGCN